MLEPESKIELLSPQRTDETIQKTPSTGGTHSTDEFLKRGSAFSRLPQPQVYDLDLDRELSLESETHLEFRQG